MTHLFTLVICLSLNGFYFNWHPYSLGVTHLQQWKKPTPIIALTQSFGHSLFFYNHLLMYLFLFHFLFLSVWNFVLTTELILLWLPWHLLWQSTCLFLSRPFAAYGGVESLCKLFALAFLVTTSASITTCLTPSLFSFFAPFPSSIIPSNCNWGSEMDSHPCSFSYLWNYLSCLVNRLLRETVGP